MKFNSNKKIKSIRSKVSIEISAINSKYREFVGIIFIGTFQQSWKHAYDFDLSVCLNSSLRKYTVLINIRNRFILLRVTIVYFLSNSDTLDYIKEILVKCVLLIVKYFRSNETNIFTNSL